MRVVFSQLAIYVLALLIISADAPKTGKRVSVEWRYVITPEPGVEKCSLTVLVPRTLDPRQTLRRIRFSHEPVERRNSGNNAYARFFFHKPAKPVTVTVTADLELFPDGLVNHPVRETEPLKPEDRERALASEQYLEADAAPILALARQVTAEETVKRLEQIQNLVSTKVKRGDFDPTDRGALAALQAGKGDCSEFADLFVAICRASRLPAVVCEGYTLDAGLLRRANPHHNWASVFVENRGWVSFDPLDVATRIGRFESQTFWYIQLSDQRNDTLLNGHLYAFQHWGAKVTVDATFQVLRTAQ